MYWHVLRVRRIPTYRVYRLCDIISRGNCTPGSRVATPVATRHSEAKYCNSFQLTHRPRGNHALSIASNGDQKEDKTLLQHAQVSQHSEFQHVNVSE